MSRELPVRARPINTAVLLREAFIAVNDRMIRRLVETGHGAVRPAHGAVFQYLDDEGTTVARLAERAQMTKQAMAELVTHLEKHGYVTRVADPNDGRAKRVLPTDKGREVIDIAQELIPQVERELDELLGPERADALRSDLERVIAHG